MMQYMRRQLHVSRLHMTTLYNACFRVKGVTERLCRGSVSGS